MHETSAALLEPGDPRWDAALRAVPHDIYHTPAYLRATAATDGGEPRALWVEDADDVLLAPLVVRALPAGLGVPGLFDAASPYGYGSPVSRARGERLSALLSSGLGHLAGLGCVTLFARSHPLLAFEPEVLSRFGTVVPHGQTVYVDLAVLPSDVEPAFRSGHRGDLRKLRAAGFSAVMDDWGRYGRFQEVYLETMERIGSSPYYRFDPAYFSSLREELGSALHVCLALAPDGDLAAAGLFMECDGIVEYHLSGTTEAYVRSAPSKLMLAEAIAWARDAGHRVMHLGGGLGREGDSLLAFKGGFSTLRADFHTWRAVLRRADFDALNAQAGAGADASLGGFFPPYRSR